MDWLGTTWDAVFGWFDRLTAEGWAALGTWAAVLAAVAAGFYARKQVAEARTLRREQAQPNVAMFIESNAVHWHMLELVVKNFGTTPAYHITMEFNPKPQVSPSASREEITDLWVPDEIPILVPGQEWRTLWDHAPTRFEHGRLASRHEATVKYEDNKRKAFDTEAVLDWGALKDANRVVAKGVHELAELLESQNDALGEIAASLAGFSRQSEGVWVFTGDGAAEGEKRATERAERGHRSKAFQDKLLGLTQTADDGTEQRSSEAPAPAPEP